MEEMDFSSCKDDIYSCLRSTLKSIGVEDFQCVILYVENVLVIMEEPERFLRKKHGK